jgi:cytochrome c-type protein NapC
MASSIFSDPFLGIALGLAALSVVLLAWYLVRRPALTRATKVVLLFGIGLLPIGTAANGNIAGYHATKTRRFCASSCHVMTPYGDDSDDRASTSLAARHARNEAFGDESCYACHADYGMFGTVATKVGGMRHVYYYVTAYHDMPIDRFVEEIRIRKPFPNATCTHCHSTLLPGWQQVPDHKAMQDPEAVSCASKGCHGPAHPFAGAAR